MRRTAVAVVGLLAAIVAGERPAPAETTPCSPLPQPDGRVVDVATVADLVTAVDAAEPEDTIRIADGTYDLDGAWLWVDTPGVTLRSAGGDRDAVVLDGGYVTTEIIVVAASDVTVADLTLRRARYHPIHVVAGVSSDTLGTLLYNVRIVDPGQQAVKINPSSPAGPTFVDDGTIACSSIELTDAGRSQVWAINGSCYTGGVDAHAARGWTIRDNVIQGFWCPGGLSEHGIHLWRGCRDTVVERNLLRDDARGIGFGLAASGDARTYADDPCPGAGYVDHYGGVIRNNFVFASASGLFSSAPGFDCGICLASACGAEVLHNTVASTQPPTASSVEWRFETTEATITNNLATHNFWQRDGATALLSGNLTGQPLTLFADGAGGDLHLAPSATSAIDAVAAPPGVADDVDGDPRPLGAAADVGADERPPGEPIFSAGFESGGTDAWSGSRGDVTVAADAAYIGAYGLRVAVGSCSSELRVPLEPEMISDHRSVNACDRITLGDGVVLADGGDLTCTAGHSIVLGDGFSVLSGGMLTAVLDGTLDPLSTVTDDSPAGETSYGVELFANFDELVLGTGDELEHLVGLASDGTPAFRVLVRSGPVLDLEVRDDAGGLHRTPPVSAAPGWNRIAVSWQSETDATASFAVGAGPSLVVNGIDTSAQRLDSVRWGVVGGSLSASAGTILLDAFTSWR